MFTVVCQQPLKSHSSSIDLGTHLAHVRVVPFPDGERGVRYWMSARLDRLRELFKASKQYVRNRPPLKWAFRVLYWSPLYVAFLHYGYTIKYVSGRSMQVLSTNINS